MKYLAKRYLLGLFCLFSVSFLANVYIIHMSMATYKENIVSAISLKTQNGETHKVVQEVLTSANAGISEYILIALVLLHVFLFFCLAIGWYKALKRNVIPIEELSAAMDNFSFVYSEDFPRFEFEGREEIANLARSFNQMRHKVLETVSDIKSMSKYKQEFMTNVTHELKTPLTSILGYIETLESGAIDDPEHNKNFLEAIKRNVQRLSNLVGDILNLSKIESRQSVKKKINILDVFQLVAKDYDLYNKKNVSIVVSYKNIRMYADADEIYSAFSNYIANALKYSPDGDIRITFSKKDNQIFFSVRDTGPGIDEEYIPRIFERFYRIDKGRSRKDGGTGLGLAIVKNVIEKYGGKVGVTSFVGKGSDFYFNLPIENVEP
ncbi:MAG: HAMP domain-containing sensor histidine kinase [Candidatus Riflemargulisbacteria bacterium]